jgi:hypothetical protein
MREGRSNIHCVHETRVDEVMTYGSSIYAYLVFGLGRASTEGTTRRTKIIAWRGPGAKLDAPSWIRFSTRVISNWFYLYFAWRTILRPNLHI